MVRLSYFWRAFWAFYLFFFLFIFPNFFGGGWAEEAVTGSAKQAFLVLGIGFFLWLLLFCYLAKLTLLVNYCRKRKFRKLSQKGLEQLGVIHSRSVLRAGAHKEKLELEIRFENLQGARVGVEFNVVDKQLERFRYQEGSHVQLAIDPTFRRPIVVLEDSVTLFSPLGKITTVVMFVLLVAAALGVLLLDYSLYSGGNGWRFLRFYHPFFYEPILGLLALWLVSYYIGGTRRLKLKMISKHASAQVLSYYQTRTYINEQPVVAFDLSFKDTQGRSQKTTLKQIIPFTELNYLPQIKNIDILYNPDNPQQVVWGGS